jgi:23S rRNA (uracil1939-C5)-methyltransferase
MNKAKITAYDEKSRRGLLKHIGLRYSFAEDRYLLILVTSGSKLPFSNVICNELLKHYPRISGIVQNINRNLTNRILADETKLLYRSEYLTEKIGEYSYRIHYSSFFQVNTAQTEAMLNHIRELVKPDEVVIDAYSGIGTVGIYLAERVKKVYFLEQYEPAVEDGEENCRINNLSNCFFVSCKVEDEIDRIIRKIAPSTIVLDPPRKGIDRNIIDSISAGSIRKVIYISCDIATQKRDLSLLIERGFQLASIKPFDMFPHTYHIENVTLLTR